MYLALPGIFPARYRSRGDQPHPVTLAARADDHAVGLERTTGYSGADVVVGIERDPLAGSAQQRRNGELLDREFIREQPPSGRRDDQGHVHARRA